MLLTEDPYNNNTNFPNQVSGLCANDTFPTPGAETVPGTTVTYAPTAGPCSGTVDGITSDNLIIQLMSPANRQTGVSVTPKLDWNAYYTDGGALSTNMKYDVYLVEDGKGTLSKKCVAQNLAYNVSSFDQIGRAHV